MSRHHTTQFERSIVAEFALRERQALRLGPHPRRARHLAERLHRGHDELLAHLRRVAHAVPMQCRAVAWLHHAHAELVAADELRAAGVTSAEEVAIGLLVDIEAPRAVRPRTPPATRIAAAPGQALYLARTVARASLRDPFHVRPADGVDVAVLHLLTGP
jgi:hypothetical protein